MARKDKIEDTSNPVSGDFDDVEMDFNFDSEDDSGKRVPSKPLKAGVIQGVKNHFTDSKNIRAYVGKTMPKEYGNLFDDYTKVSGAAETVLSEIKKAGQQPVNQIAKILKDKVKKDGKAHKFLSRVAAATEKQRSGSSYNQEAERENWQAATIGTMFSEFQEQNEAARADSEAVEDDRFARQFTKLQSQETLLGIAAKNSDFQRAYTEKVDIPWKKKTLELQYRMANSLADMLVLQKGWVEQQKTQLNKLITNAALPEVAKQNLKENFKQDIRNRFVSGTIGAVTGTGGAQSPLNGFLERLQKNLVSSVRMGMMGLGAGADLLEQMNEEEFAFDEEDRRRNAINKVAGRVNTGLSAIGPALAGKAAKAGLKKNPRADRFLKQGNDKIAYGRNNMMAELQAFIMRSDGSAGTNLLRDFLAMGMGGQDKGKDLGRIHGMELNNAANFDGHSRAALVEVIPGLLSRILQEAQIARTGDASIGRMVFNHKKGVFESAKAASSNLDKIAKASAVSQYEVRNMMQPLKDAGIELTEAEEKALTRTIISGRKGGRSMTAKALMNESFYKGTASEVNSAKMAESFKKAFTGERGEHTKGRFFSQVAHLDNRTETLRQALQEMSNSGNLDIAEQAGWLKDGQIDLERVFDAMAGHNPTISKRDSLVPSSHRSRRIGPIGGNSMAVTSKHVTAPEASLDIPQRQLDLTQEIRDTIKSFFERSHLDATTSRQQSDILIKEMVRLNAIIFNSSFGSVPGMGSRMDAASATAKQTIDAAKEKLSEAASGAGQSAGQSYEKFKEESRKFWNKERPILSKLGMIGDSLGKAGAGLGGLLAAGTVGAGKLLGRGAHGAFDNLRKTTLFGARKFSQYKDGIPDIGEVFKFSAESPTITLEMFTNGSLRDRMGKIITSLSELAQAEGDILNERDEVILTTADLKRTYVKADGRVFTQVWADRISRAAKRGGVLARAFAEMAGKGARRGGLFGARVTAGLAGTAKEMLLPAVDVYLEGDKEPKLYAQQMRAGLYFNEDGSPVRRAIEIKGQVLDVNNNVVLNHEDLKRRLVDVYGQPFQSLGQRLGSIVRGNLKRAGVIASGVKNTLFRVGRKAKNVAMYGLSGAGAAKYTDGKAAGVSSDYSLTGGSDDTLVLLTQIRDILAQRLTNSHQGPGFNPNFVGPMMPGGPRGGESSSTSSSHDTIGKMMNAVGAGAKGAMDTIGGLFGRRGRRSRLDATRSEASTAEAKEENLNATASVKKEVKDLEKSQSKSNRGLNFKLDTLMKKFTTGGFAAGGAPKSGSTDDRLANYKNVNASDKSLEDIKMPEQIERKNTIDLAMDMAKKMMDGARDFLGMGGGALDDLLDGPDRSDRRGGRGSRGPRPRGRIGRAIDWAKRGVGLGRPEMVGPMPKQGKPGLFKRALNGVGRAVGGTGERVGKVGRAFNAVKNGFGAVSGFLGRMGVKRVLGGIATGAAAALGAPMVATGLAIVGAVWTAKEIYDFFKEKKPDQKQLYLIRMAEYGAAMGDTSAHARIDKIEQFAMRHVKFADGGSSLSKDDIKIEELFDVADIPAESQKMGDRFVTWFNGRFTPTFLKWMNPANALTSKSLAKLDDLDVEGKLKVVAATAKPSGWNVDTNPFGDKPLTVGPREVSLAREALTNNLNKEKDERKAKGGKDASEMTKKEAFKEVDKLMQEGMMKPMTDERMKKQTQALGKIQDVTSNRNVASFNSRDAIPISSGAISKLMSLRMRMYGWTTITSLDLASITKMEETLRPYMTVDNKGKAKFNGDVSLIYRNSCPFFGLSPEDIDSEILWSAWFTRRFLPVYATYLGNAMFHAGTDKETLIESQAGPVRVFAIVQSVTSLNGVWRLSVKPYKDFVINEDPATVYEIIDFFRKEASKAEAKEDISKPMAQNLTVAEKSREELTQRNAQEKALANNTATRTRPTVVDASYERQQAAKMMNAKLSMGPSTPAMPVSPEAEAEPKSSGGVALKPPTNQVMANAPTGPIRVAGGDLSAGHDGYAYIKSPTKEDFENLNPEVKKLFLGMAEEYGKMTGNTIKINRGFASRTKQQALWDADLASNGGRPTGKVARPGGSQHEYGLGIDVDTVVLNELESKGLLKKYGFTRPVGGETWHLEPAGIQHNPTGLRNDPDALAAAIQNGVGKGGGGIGHQKNIAALGTRNRERALAYFNAAGLAVASGGLAEQMDSYERVGAETPIQSDRSSSDYGRAPTSSGSSMVTGQGSGSDDLYRSLQLGEGREGLMRLVSDAAGGVGVDPKSAMIKVAVESGYKTSVKAGTSSATGLYQFTSGTWGDMMRKYGDKYGIPPGTSPSDAKANAILGALYTKDNMQIAGKKGLNQDLTTAYLMHFLGPGGGPKFLGLPEDAIPAKEMTSAADANKSIFFNQGVPRTKAEMLENIQQRIRKAARDYGIDENLDLGSAPASPSYGEPSRGTTTKAPQETLAPRGGSRSSDGMMDANFRQPPTTAEPNRPQPAPAITKSDTDMLRLLSETGKVHVEQLKVQTEIRDGITELKEVLEKSLETRERSSMPNLATQAANQPQGQQVVSRAERAMRAVPKPTYRVV